MAIRDWSGQRIAMVWLIGALCEVTLLILPGVAARRYLQRNLPRLQREHAQMRAELAAADSAWRLTERADSLSLATQRRAAIDAGQYSLNAQGDTLVAVVRTPSARPDSVAIATSLARTSWVVVAIALIIWGSIPVVLLWLTARWIVVRRRRALATTA